MTRRQIDDRKRLRVLQLVDVGRLTRQEIADQLGIGRSTVQKILATRNNDGHKAVFRRKKNGPHHALTPEEEKAVLSSIVNIPPANFGPRNKYYQDNSFTWTWPKIGALIESGLGKTLSRSTIVRLLIKWGMWVDLADHKQVFEEARRNCVGDSVLMFGPGKRRIGVVWVTHFKLPLKIDLWESQESLKLIGRKDFTLLTALFGRGERHFAVIAGAYSKFMLMSFANMVHWEHRCRDSLYLLVPRTRTSEEKRIAYDGFDALRELSNRQKAESRNQLADEIDVEFDTELD